MEERLDAEIEEIIVSGFVRRRRDYVFQIDVTWSDGGKLQLFRRYADFASFHRALIKRYQATEKVPPLPSFKNLFSRLYQNDSTFRVPQFHLLNDYCAAVIGTFDNLFVLSFFYHCQYDSNLRRRKLRRYNKDSDIRCHADEEYLVLSDFNDGNFSIQGGEVVMHFGSDSEGWKMVGYEVKNDMKFGWLPDTYLVPKGSEEDPVFDDIKSYILALRKEDGKTSPQYYSQEADIVECMDLMTSGVNYCMYRVIEDCYLSCHDCEDVLLREGTAVFVVDRDKDGWWYVSCLEEESEGWLPSTVLEPRRASLRQYKDYDKIYQPIEGSIDFLKPVPFYVKKSYRANQTDEISLASGEWVHVLHQSYSGWWTVKSQQTIGLAPALHFFNKQIDDEISFVGRAYNVGFNSSLLSLPPPRREEIASSYSSPISPPLIDDSVFLEIDSTSCSDKEISPIPTGYHGDINTILSDVQPQSDQFQINSLPSSPANPFIGTEILRKDETLDIPVRFLSPVASNYHYQSMSLSHSPLSTSPAPFSPNRSPIPMRFFKKKTPSPAPENVSEEKLAVSSQLPNPEENTFSFDTKNTKIFLEQPISHEEESKGFPVQLPVEYSEHTTLSGYSNGIGAVSMNNEENQQAFETAKEYVSDEEIQEGTSKNLLPVFLSQGDDEEFKSVRTLSLSDKLALETCDPHDEERTHKEPMNIPSFVPYSEGFSFGDTNVFGSKETPLVQKVDFPFLTKTYMSLDISDDDDISLDEPVVKQLPSLTSMSLKDLERRSRSAPPPKQSSTHKDENEVSKQNDSFDHFHSLRKSKSSSLLLNSGKDPSTLLPTTQISDEIRQSKHSKHSHEGGLKPSRKSNTKTDRRWSPSSPNDWNTLPTNTSLRSKIAKVDLRNRSTSPLNSFIHGSSKTFGKWLRKGDTSAVTDYPPPSKDFKSEEKREENNSIDRDPFTNPKTDQHKCIRETETSL